MEHDELTARLKFPEELPICAHRAEIERALASSRVVVVCGETGSGKTTQLPKMLLECGFGARGRRIACTQPRRIAAVTVARRVAEEFGEPVGESVGYQHRFERKVSRNTRIKFMTDGVLLAETRSDPLLRAYDAVMLDEAHERSLNIDFLLGILKRILQKRRDLKVVVSSATLDAGLFSAFFGGAPVLSVPGRLHPVTLRYLPPEDGDEADLARDVRNAIASLPPDGDILVFLPGERDIRECAEALSAPEFRDDETIPLLGSLPAQEQQKAFRLSSRRRIVLATNVAETSVTIPGIRYVVDSGLARISRYVHRTQIQKLQIEPVSQASANQRAGRCGRVGPGTCIRLYSEEDFLRRDRYATPEMLRSSLAGVILAMLDLNLGDVEDFPFISPPDGGMVREGMRELSELGAIAAGPDGKPVLTHVGRTLATLPVEPRIARMVLAAAEGGVLPSVIPIAAFLAGDDPRRRPIEEKEKADQAHAKFKTPNSDFASILKMWRWYEEQTAGVSQNQARKLCKANYLSFAKMREWRDLASQLTAIAKRTGFDTTRDTASDEAIHKALLAGLLGRVGLYDGERREYRGARGVRFAPFPASVLFKRPPRWIMAGELVDTSRLYARQGAAIDPAWIEPVAGPLCKHHYDAPWWDAEAGFVRAFERVTLYGLTVVEGRRCDYSRVDPAGCRDIFIRRGILDCAIRNPRGALKEAFAVIAEIRDRADKLRRPDLFDEDALAAHFDRALPPGLCTARDLQRWLVRASRGEVEAFVPKKEDWLPEEDAAEKDFPDKITIHGRKMALLYRHSLVDDEDGITCVARLDDAPLLREWRFEWLVPGAIREKLFWMLSALPSAQRRILSPLDETVARLASILRPGEESLAAALSRALRERWGLPVRPEAWDGIRMPPHFSVKFRIMDNRLRKTLAEGRDLEKTLAEAGVGTADDSGGKARKEPAPHTSWDFGDIPPEKTAGEAGWTVKRYAALEDLGDGVALRHLPTRAAAEKTHAQGVARLYVLKLGPKAVSRTRIGPLPLQSAFLLDKIGYDPARLAADALFGAVAETFVRDQPPVFSEAAFSQRFAEREETLGDTIAALRATLSKSLEMAGGLRIAAETDARIPSDTAQAVRNQLDWLVFKGFAKTVPFQRLRHYPRYLEAATTRLEKAKHNPEADRRHEEEVAVYWRRYREAVAGGSLETLDMKALVEYRWLVEEYRVSLFAQELKTPLPVSAKRLDALWDKVVNPRVPL